METQGRFRLAVFGASGRTGRQVLAAGLARGLEIMAFTRRPEALAEGFDGATLVAGDLMNANDVARALAHAQAVLSVMGPTANRPVYEISAGTARIIDGMREAGVKRLVVTAGAGVRHPADVPGVVDRVMRRLVLAMARHVHEDMRRTVDTVMASDLDWTVVRVPRLTDGPGRGSVRVGMVGKGTGISLTRTDLARFLIDVATSDQYLRQAPVVSN